MIVAKKVTFDASHLLPTHKGKCKNLHGHRWAVELAVRGPVIEGMVLDFTYLNDFLKTFVVDRYDHTHLNDVIPDPTAENIALDIEKAFMWLQKGGHNVSVVEMAWITVWETPDSYAMLEGE